MPAVLLCLWISAAPPGRAALPLETFFRNDAYHDLLISPDGARLAAIRSSRGTRNLFVRSGLDAPEVEITDREWPEAVLWSAWASDRRLLYGVLETDRRGARVVNFYGIDADGGKELRLGGEGYFDDRRHKWEMRRDIRYFRYVDEEIVHWLPTDPDHVLISSDRRSADFRHVYRLDLNDGRRQRELRAPGRRAGYLADHSGVVRVAWTTERDLTNRLLYRSGADQPWRELGRYRFDDRNLLPLAFTADDRRLYVLSNLDHDKRALYVYDPEVARPEELVFRHPEVDVSNALFSRDHADLIGVVYITDRHHTYYIDPAVRAAAEALQRRWPDQRVHYVNASDGRSRLLFLIDGNRTPGAYYLVASDGSVREIAVIAPWIEPERLAPTRPVEFEARDGLRLNAFLTLPLDRPVQELPLLIVPHGGPYAVRDTADFDPEIKFLADRGYAVLQINFRGSAGYGLDFATAGHREWGRKMQDDITDGVHWAIETGIADADRVCIYGSSYGGYAALMGLVLTPDLYRCGISYAGVSDLSLLFEYQVVGGGMLVGDVDDQRFWEIVVGDPDDRDRLRELSPVHRVEAIRAPVLIAHGGRDYIARADHALRLRKALERHGKAFDWLFVPEEGHGFSGESNRFALYARMEQFLAEHLTDR